MSDHEGPSGAGDDELSLPKATVQKLIAGEPSVSTAPVSTQADGCQFYSEILPKDILSSKESRDLIIECCVGMPFPLPCSLCDTPADYHLQPEFIHMISTEANEICEKEAKKTISPEHIVGALKVKYLVVGGLYNAHHA